jgi:hypothetical protein
MRAYRELLQQRGNIEVRCSTQFHVRFIVLDGQARWRRRLIESRRRHTSTSWLDANNPESVFSAVPRLVAGGTMRSMCMGMLNAKHKSSLTVHWERRLSTIRSKRLASIIASAASIAVNSTSR